MLARMAFFSAAMRPRLHNFRMVPGYPSGPLSGCSLRFKHTNTNSSPANQPGTTSTTLTDTKPTSSAAEHIALAAFFAAYPSFEYDPNADARQECQRLFRFLGVEKLSKANPLRGELGNEEVRRRGEVRGRMKVELRAAIARQYDESDDIEKWKDLCRNLDIGPVPDTLEECKKVISLTHVNLVDFTALKKDETATKYATEVELSEYTKTTKKFFPRKELEAGDVRRALLRQIINPRPEWKVLEDAEAAYEKAMASRSTKTTGS